jgi:hypothetical protein
MPERPRPDIDQVRQALRQHDDAHEAEETPVEPDAEPAPEDESSADDDD